ncbi:MAG: hypothetical protein ABSF24_00230 [Candidatus Bathyarchaeia archaeon]|jgi:hypothetical protein
MSERTEIPAPVKRIVRQEAGFGCCKCGQPIVQYHHIVRKSKKPEDIMLLCPFPCHYKATHKVMTKKEQLFYKSNPYNIKQGFVQGQLEVNQNIPIVNVGTSQIIGTGDLVAIDGENLLSLNINKNRIEISATLYDQQNRLAAKIMNNEWVSGNPLPWDLESGFQWLKIRRKKRDIELEIDARAYPINMLANIWKNQHNLRFSPKQIIWESAKTHVRFAHKCFVAMKIEAETTNSTFTLSPDPRIGTFAVITDLNRKKRIRRGLKIWQELSKKKGLK